MAWLPCRLFVAGVLACLMVKASAAGAGPTTPDIKAASAILVDFETGQVLFERNADQRRPPASTTKIMTAILLLEHLPLDTMVEADKEASETDGSSLYMAPGERIRAEHLLYAIMLRSANDACVAVAKAVAGSPEAFVEMMNRKAAELGATNTHFANPNGLHHPDHYTTARDLATMARYAMRNTTFRKVAATQRYIIERDPENKDTYLKNKNKLLGHYPGADGIKTGYTVPAGRCLVASATRGGWRLIAVVLGSPDLFAEAQQLLNYGFNTYEPVVLVQAGQRIAPVAVSGGDRPVTYALVTTPLQLVRRRGDHRQVDLRPEFGVLRAPVAQYQVIGSLAALVEGEVVARVPLQATTSVAQAHPEPDKPHGHIPRAAGTIAALVVFWHVSTNTQDTRRRRRGLTEGV